MVSVPREHSRVAWREAFDKLRVIFTTVSINFDSSSSLPASDAAAVEDKGGFCVPLT
jgi:hypothetical protein